MLSLIKGWGDDTLPPESRLANAASFNLSKDYDVDHILDNKSFAVDNNLTNLRLFNSLKNRGTKVNGISYKNSQLSDNGILGRYIDKNDTSFPKEERGKIYTMD